MGTEHPNRLHKQTMTANCRRCKLFLNTHALPTVCGWQQHIVHRGLDFPTWCSLCNGGPEVERDPSHTGANISDLSTFCPHSNPDTQDGWWPLTCKQLPWLSTDWRNRKPAQSVRACACEFIHCCAYVRQSLCASSERGLRDAPMLIAYSSHPTLLGTCWSSRGWLSRMQIRSFPWMSGSWSVMFGDQFSLFVSLLQLKLFHSHMPEGWGSL